MKTPPSHPASSLSKSSASSSPAAAASSESDTKALLTIRDGLIVPDDFCRLGSVFFFRFNAELEPSSRYLLSNISKASTHDSQSEILRACKPLVLTFERQGLVSRYPPLDFVKTSTQPWTAEVIPLSNREFVPSHLLHRLDFESFEPETPVSLCVERKHHNARLDQRWPVRVLQAAFAPPCELDIS